MALNAAETNIIKSTWADVTANPQAVGTLLVTK